MNKIREPELKLSNSQILDKQKFDATKPDGTMRKLIDVSKLHSLGWTHKVEIEDRVAKLFEWYRQSLN